MRPVLTGLLVGLAAVLAAAVVSLGPASAGGSHVVHSNGPVEECGFCG